MSRADSIAAERWRAMHTRVDGTVQREISGDEGDVRAWFHVVELQPGERCILQVRRAGKSRYSTVENRATL